MVLFQVLIVALYSSIDILVSVQGYNLHTPNGQKWLSEAKIGGFMKIDQVAFASTEDLLEELGRNIKSRDKWASVWLNPGTTDPAEYDRTRKLAKGLIFQADQWIDSINKELDDRRDLERFMREEHYANN